MKKGILIIFALLTTGFVNAQKINWMSFNEALEAQKITPKKIFVDAYTVWCGPCKMLDKNTFQNKDVAAYVNENFYPVKFNAEGDEIVNYKGITYSNPGFNPNTSGRNSSHELSQSLRINSYPTILFFDENAELLAPIPGYRTPQELEIFLKLFASNDYKNVQSQEDWNSYSSNFKPEFSN